MCFIRSLAGCLGAIGVTIGLGASAVGQGALTEPPYGTWEMTVKAGAAETSATMLRLQLARDGTGKIVVHTKGGADRSAGLEFRLEERAKQPTLVIRKCKFLCKEAEVVIPYRIEVDHLRLQNGKIEYTGGEADLKGAWQRVDEKKEKPRP